MGYALGAQVPTPRERELGYRAHFERMGHTEELAMLDQMRTQGASRDEVAASFTPAPSEGRRLLRPPPMAQLRPSRNSPRGSTPPWCGWSQPAPAWTQSSPSCAPAARNSWREAGCLAIAVLTKTSVSKYITAQRAPVYRTSPLPVRLCRYPDLCRSCSCARCPRKPARLRDGSFPHAQPHWRQEKIIAPRLPQ